MATALLCWFSGSVLSVAGTSGPDIERQFQSDMEQIIRAEWKFEGEKLRKAAEEQVAGIKSLEPDRFKDYIENDYPSDDDLRRGFEEMLRARKREPGPHGVWKFYVSRWRSNSLMPIQRIIFLRDLAALTAEAERNSRELERLRKKG